MFPYQRSPVSARLQGRSEKAAPGQTGPAAGRPAHPLPAAQTASRRGCARHPPALRRPCLHQQHVGARAQSRAGCQEACSWRRSVRTLRSTSRLYSLTLSTVLAALPVPVASLKTAVARASQLASESLAPPAGSWRSCSTKASMVLALAKQAYQLLSSLYPEGSFYHLLRDSATLASTPSAPPAACILMYNLCQGVLASSGRVASLERSLWTLFMCYTCCSVILNRLATTIQSCTRLALALGTTLTH